VSCRGMSGLPKRAIIIVFSLHMGEPLVLDLAMLSFISLLYTVLHHNFQFYLIAFILGWYSCDSRYNDWLFRLLFFLGIFMFFLMFFFRFWVHGVSYRFYALKIPLLSFIVGSRIWMDNQRYFKASLRRRLLLRLN
jgi:hypothetical protein